MYRDRRWKLVAYHGKQIYELYDLENDPWEHQDLSEDPASRGILWDLVGKSLDATARSYARGAPRIAHY
jgi:arylsulfatase A-like enzyme